MMKKIVCSVFFAGLLFPAFLSSSKLAAQCSTIVYVNPAATGASDGTSWANAWNQLADALNYTTCGEIWVKGSSYFPIYDETGNPAPSDLRRKTFFMKNNVALYGGFNGTETEREQRNVTANPTILTGSQGTLGNAYNVVWARNVNNTSILDGFTVTGGVANGSFPNRTYSGGGILIGEFNQLVVPNPVIRHCIFEGNTGGDGGAMAIYALNGNSSPLIEFCTFSSNTATNYSAAVHFGAYSFLTVINPQFNSCTFSNNIVTNPSFPTSMYLGAQNNGTVSPSFSNCKFFNNSKLYLEAFSGVNTTVSPYFENCIFSVGEISMFSVGSITSPVFRNSSFQQTDFRIQKSSGGVCAPSFLNIVLDGTILQNTGDPTIAYSLIKSVAACPAGFTCGDGMIYNMDPQFVDANGPDDLTGTADDDLHLQPCSPAVNQGTAASSPVTDLDNQPRPYLGGAVDIGAYELQATVDACDCVAVCESPSNLMASGITANSATVGWGAQTCADKYQIRYRYQTAPGVWSDFGGWTTYLTNTANLTGLQSALHQWQVRSKCGTAFSTPSTGTFNTCTGCESPSNLAASNITSNAATVQWTYPSPGCVSQYRVRYRYRLTANPISWSAWSTLTYSTAAMQSLTGLLGGKLYQWQVSAKCTSGWSGVVAHTFFTPVSFAPPGTGTQAALQLSAYPNPSTDGVFQLGLPENTDQLEVYDAFGQLLLRPGTTETELNLGTLPAGVYWLKAMSMEGRTGVLKLVRN